LELSGRKLHYLLVSVLEVRMETFGYTFMKNSHTLNIPVDISISFKKGKEIMSVKLNVVSELHHSVLL
jgi:hypothetical protein